MKSNFNPPHAYWRMRNAIEGLCYGRGNLGEKLEDIRSEVVIATALDSHQKKNESIEYKENCEGIGRIYSKYPPKGMYHKPLKSAHWRVQKDLAKKILNFYLYLIESY